MSDSERDRAGGAAPGGRRRRTAASIAPGACGKDGDGSRPWWPGQGRWQLSLRQAQGLSGHCPAPRDFRRSLHGFQRCILRRRGKKNKKKTKNYLVKWGKSFPAAALLERLRGAGTMRPGTDTPLRAAEPHLSLLTVQEGSAPCSGPIPPPKPPTLPGRAFATGPGEPSTGGGRGKPRSAGWHLRRALLNPDISPSHPSLHPLGEPERSRAHPEQPGQRFGISRAEGRGFGGRGSITLKRSSPRAEIPSSWSIPPPTWIQSWKLSSLEKNLLKLIGCEHN